MIRTVELLVPPGRLVVEQTFQEITADQAMGEVVAVWETCRTPYLNGELIWWRPDTWDLLRAAGAALDLLPSPIPGIPLVGRETAS